MLPRKRCGRTCVAGWFSMSLVGHRSEGDGRSGSSDPAADDGTRGLARCDDGDETMLDSDDAVDMEEHTDDEDDECDEAIRWSSQRGRWETCGRRTNGRGVIKRLN